MTSGDVEALARLGPQGLHRVHRAAVGLQADHLAIRACERRPGGERQSDTDSAAGDLQVVVRGRAPRPRQESRCGGERLVDDDRAFRK